MDIDMWRFRKIGVPLNHPCQYDFLPSALKYPHLWNPHRPLMPPCHWQLPIKWNLHILGSAGRFDFSQGILIIRGVLNLENHVWILPGSDHLLPFLPRCAFLITDSARSIGDSSVLKMAPLLEPALSSPLYAAEALCLLKDLPWPNYCIPRMVGKNHRRPLYLMGKTRFLWQFS